MPWFHEFLTSISRSRPRSRPRLGIRALAASLSVALVLGTVSPGIAFAGEADSEQEGSAPPGALPGLEEAPELEPGGEEAALEELPGAAVGSEEGPPIETEPALESELQTPPAETPAPAAEAAPPAGEEAAVVPGPGPEYGPAYEPAPPPGSTPVENQPLAAPPPGASPEHSQTHQNAAQPTYEAPVPAAPPEEAPAPERAPPATPLAQPSDAAGSLTGHRVHTVRAGECLWSIAAALLPGGANNAEIAAEVQRLWKLNADRIGTGDPNLLYVGTDLRLH
jgi:hypothetical protein